MALVVGRLYTRDQIHNELGGSKQSYLPTVDGRVVCGCFSAELNPHAPYEILVGDGPVIQANAYQLVRQGGSIPVFMKQGSNRWEYRGRFRAKGCSTDPTLLRRKGLEVGRIDVTMVLDLEDASSS